MDITFQEYFETKDWFNWSESFVLYGINIDVSDTWESLTAKYPIESAKVLEGYKYSFKRLKEKDLLWI